MSSPNQNRPDDDLQFDMAEPAAPTGGQAAPAAAGGAVVTLCAGCRRPIEGTYYAIRDNAVCPACVQQLQNPLPGSKTARIFKATAFGLGAGLVGALIWFLIRRLAHLEIGLVAVAVGFMVGKAVRAGSAGRGGRVYQFLAVAITYGCISANYMPDIVQALVQQYKEDHAEISAVHTSATQPALHAASTRGTDSSVGSTDSPAASKSTKPRPGFFKIIGLILLLVVIVFGIALAAPVLTGMDNPIGLLIVGIALWEAWKLASPMKLPITGPYQLGPKPPAGGGLGA